MTIQDDDASIRRKLEDLTEIMRNRFLRRIDLLVELDKKIDMLKSNKDIDAFQVSQVKQTMRHKLKFVLLRRLLD